MRRVLTDPARVVAVLLFTGFALGLAGARAQNPVVPAGASLSTGFASDITPVTLGRVFRLSGDDGCTNPNASVQADVFPTRVGTVRSTDGRQWTVPGPLQPGALAVDLYNDCTGTGHNAAWQQQLTTVVIDPDGVDITGYIFADNYYELYVNGRFVARDGLAMTPFNSTVVRFRATYPMTYAVKAIDWETRHGVGMEYQTFNIGDGGFLAYFSDGNGTHTDWRAETFYIAPLDDPMCVRTAGGRDSSFCSQAVRPLCAENDPGSCRALHFPIAADWMSSSFDASSWPHAVIWRPVEVTGVPAYVNYTKFFGDAEFIWTRNIRLDNLVLTRFTAAGPRLPGR